MGFYGLEAVHELSFIKVDPRRLTKQQARQVAILLRHSFIIDFPRRSDTGINTAVGRREAHRSTIGNIVPGGAEGTKQRYARPTAILAYNQQGELKAYLDAADNSSSRVESKYPKLEIAAKLHWKRYLDSRFHAYGMVALGSGMRPTPSKSFKHDTVNVLDVMGFISAEGKPDDQSVSAYSWTGEDWLEYTLASWGLQNAADDYVLKDEFGDGDPVKQRPWRLRNGLHIVREEILNKEGAPFALEHAFISAGLA